MTVRYRHKQDVLHIWKSTLHFYTAGSLRLLHIADDSDRYTMQSVSLEDTRVSCTEQAQAFLNSVEHSLNQLDDTQSTISQRRADAAVLMAESSLQAAGREIATADRYQVIVSVEASELSPSEPNKHTQPKCAQTKRPTIKGAGPVARDTARRITCDCSLTHHDTRDGEPTNIGRKSRLWPAAMSRAIKDRDQHCQYPGCSKTHHLQIHHITHWADGGVTSIENGVTVCSFHHTMLHEGGHVIQKVDGNAHRMAEQFTHQQHASDLAMFDVEKQLRNDKASFADVRALSPTRYRFRVVDANGTDIRYSQSTVYNAANGNLQNSEVNSETSVEDTRVTCAEPVSGIYSHQVGDLQRRFIGITEATQLTTEQPARYQVVVACH